MAKRIIGLLVGGILIIILAMGAMVLWEPTNPITAVVDDGLYTVTGFDPRGSTTFTVQATSTTSMTPQQMHDGLLRDRDILIKRLVNDGIAHPQVTVAGDGTLTVVVPKTKGAWVPPLLQTGSVEFINTGSNFIQPGVTVPITTYPASQVIANNADIAQASLGFETNQDPHPGAPLVLFTLNAHGATAMLNFTQSALGGTCPTGQAPPPANPTYLTITLDRVSINSAEIAGCISNLGEITGITNIDDVNQLVVDMQSSALPVPLRVAATT